MTNLIYDVMAYPNDPDKLIFVIKDGYYINIVVADMIKNSVKEI